MPVTAWPQRLVDRVEVIADQAATHRAQDIQDTEIELASGLLKAIDGRAGLVPGINGGHASVIGANDAIVKALSHPAAMAAFRDVLAYSKCHAVDRLRAVLPSAYASLYATDMQAMRERAPSCRALKTITPLEASANQKA